MDESEGEGDEFNRWIKVDSMDSLCSGRRVVAASASMVF